jgi:hypothetical protein
MLKYKCSFLGYMYIRVYQVNGQLYLTGQFNIQI